MTGLFLVGVNTPQANYGRDYLKQDMKAAGQSFTGLLSASFSTLQSVSESWVCHFAVDAEMVSKNQFYHMVRD